MLPYVPVEIEEYGLLEAAIEASEVDVEKHGDARDLAGLAEFEEVVLEVLVASHETPRPRLLRRAFGAPRNDGAGDNSTTNSPPKSLKLVCLWCWDTLSGLGWG